MARWTPRTGIVAAMVIAGLLTVPLLPQALAARDSINGQEVDVALVLAVDISYSMDPDELELQRQGYIEALRSREFLDAVSKGLNGRVAIAYLEWAGPNSQYLIAPFTVVEGPESAAELTGIIDRAPIRRAYRTSISAALDASVKLIEESGLNALRKVIDMSGDGPNNQGRPVTEARDEALDKGISINGLPIVIKRPGYLDLDELDVYFKECVIGGPGAFAIPIRDRAQFADAIRTKLVMEIAGLTPPSDLIWRAQASGSPSCTVGERQWQQRMGIDYQ